MNTIRHFFLKWIFCCLVFLTISSTAGASCAPWFLPTAQPQPFKAYSLGEVDYSNTDDITYFLQVFKEVAQGKTSIEYLRQNFSVLDSLQDVSTIWLLENRLRLNFKTAIQFLQDNRDEVPEHAQEILDLTGQKDLEEKLAKRYLSVYTVMLEKLLPFLQGSPLKWIFTEVDTPSGTFPVVGFQMHADQPLSPESVEWIKNNMNPFLPAAQSIEGYWRKYKIEDETLTFIYFNPDLSTIRRLNKLDIPAVHHPSLIYGNDIYLPWGIFQDALIAAPLVFHEVNHYFTSWRNLHLSTTTFEQGNIDPEIPSDAFNLSELTAYTAQWNMLRQIITQFRRPGDDDDTVFRRQQQIQHLRGRIDIITTIALQHLNLIQQQINNDDFKIYYDYKILSDNLRRYAEAGWDNLSLKVNFNYKHPNFSDPLHGSYYFNHSTPDLERAAARLTGEFKFDPKFMGKPDFEDILTEFIRPKLQQVIAEQIASAQDMRANLDLPAYR